jgi:regulator of sigma D
MLYIIEPRTESDKVEAVGLPDVNYTYGENIVTYNDQESACSIQPGSLVDCNGVLSKVTEVIPMKFGRVILTVEAANSSPKTTTGALMR